ncbi:MAG: methanogenesis marker protein Mmp4/MtxX [Thermoplasmata archaeon]|nr:methanogenesis marker protein Mmp4/MtxX [Thermoplasmata archaeon]
MITTSEELLAGTVSRDIRVGIGRGTDRGLVEDSVAASGGNVDIYDDPDALAADLVSGKIGAAVRGDMPSDVLLPKLRAALGLKKLERAVLLEPRGEKMFLLAPVGIDEGWTDDQRFDIACRTADFARRVGMDSRIAVMSGGRCEDRGRCREVDRSIDSALSLVDRLEAAGYEAYHCQILVENAIREAGVIIAPEGITGNIMFRTLHFIGGAKALGAPTVNAEKVFIDTSRAKTDYRDSIALARKLAEDSQ